MKKNKFTEFFKGKGYYMLLFVGVLAIAAVALIGSNLSSNKEDKGKDYVDLNEPDNNIAGKENTNQVAENNTASGDVAQKEQNNNTASNSNAGQDVASNDDLLENDVFSEEEENGVDLAKVTPTAAPTPSAEKTDTTKAAENEPKAVETTGKTVKRALKFEADKGLLWPVEGNVIMNYSMDHTVYHATLMQFKCNPAIIIDAEVGTKVKAAANGIVTSVDTNEETGLTVKTDIGDGFSLIYGQLKDVKLKAGDRIDEGDVIGTVDEPTRYYTVEGSNLFFEVLDNDKTVNPMLYLR